MEPLLRVRNLTIGFGANPPVTRVVSGVSFDIAPGEAVGLLGESGCGKTTLALSLLGLLPPRARVVQGSIQFRGNDMLALDESRLQKVRGAQVSMIFQEPGSVLNPVMRVGDQIVEVIRAHRSWSLPRCREEAESILAAVQLSGARFYSAYPHQLSGGQRQRVLIAQALVCRPALLIADEPTSALDATAQADFLELLRELKSRFQLSLLLITHNPAILWGLADRVLVMYAGRLAEQGRLLDILQSPLHPYTKALLRSIPPPRGQEGPERRKKALAAIAGAPPDPARLPHGCPFEPRCPDRLEVCTTREPQEMQPVQGRQLRCFQYGG